MRTAQAFGSTKSSYLENSKGAPRGALTHLAVGLSANLLTKIDIAPKPVR